MLRSRLQPPEARASDKGVITLITGCMFSGKTTTLLRKVEQLPRDSVLAVKHEIDRRYSPDEVVSHGGKSRSAVSISDAVALPNLVGDRIDVVALDEAHFFGEDVVDAIEALARRGIHVLVTSLDRDSWGRPFEIVVRLGAIADEPIVVRAVCARCGRTGDRTQRLTPIVDGQMVGGSESYEPRCQACWTPPPELPPQ